eukprot:gene3928-4182_t
MPRSPARLFIPSPNSLQFSHSGVLSSVELPAGQLQHSVLGYHDAADARAGYGLIQGWLDWQDLNPAAVAWLQELEMSNSSSSGGGGGGGGGGSMGNDEAAVFGLQVQSSIAVGLPAGQGYRLSRKSADSGLFGLGGWVPEAWDAWVPLASAPAA